MSCHVIVLHGSVPPEHSVLVHGKISPPTDLPHEHTAPVAMRMPHLPITATTKTAEIKGSADSTASHPSVISEASPLSQSAASTPQAQPRAESPTYSGGCESVFVLMLLKHECSYSNFHFLLLFLLLVSSVMTRTPTPVRASGSPRLHGEPGRNTGEPASEHGIVILIYYDFVFCRQGEFSSCKICDVLGFTGERQVSGG